MTKEQAIKAAQKDAQTYNCALAIVDAPIENAEEIGTFGFGPLDGGVEILFPYGEIVAIVNEKGEVENVPRRPVDAAKFATLQMG